MASFSIYRFWVNLFWVGFFCLVSPCLGLAQEKFGNEWINYSQPYYKIKISKSGIYRLDYSYLNKAGLSNVNPQNLQLWRRGKEVAIHVEGETDGTFNETDFLEFYGQRNDGFLDKPIYKNPNHHNNPYFSLFTDTAAYFLTVSNTQGKRILQPTISSEGLQAESWHKAERLKLFTLEYQTGTYYGESRMSWGDASEGYGDQWFGTIGSGVRARIKDFEVDSLLQVEPTGPPPTAELLIEGVLRDAHDISIAIVTPSGVVRDLEKNIVFGPWDKIKKVYALQFSDISAAGKVKFRITVNVKGVADIVRMRYMRIHYPRKNIINTRNFVITPNDTLKSTPSLFTVQKLNGQTLAGFDITDPYAVKKIRIDNQATTASFVSAAPNGISQKLLIINITNTYFPGPPSRITFQNLTNRKPGFVIVYHKRLASPVPNYSNPVKAYAEYRASSTGGKHDTLTLEISQIYDQFHYGEKSIMGLRKCINYLITQGKPEFLLLMGQALLMDYDNFGRSRTVPTAASRLRDMVPTAAPASDIFITSDWEKDQYFPKVATGRIAAYNPEEIVAYLEKVKEHESLPDNLEWRKNILHLGGGDTDQLKAYIKNALTRWKTIAERTYFGGKVNSIYRLNTTGTEKLNVSSEINAGVSLITFFGHSSPQTNDLDIGMVTDPVNGYNNTGKYPMMIMNGCASGNPFLDNTFGVNWLLAPKKGIILYMAHTATGYTNLLQMYSEQFYKVAFSDSLFYGKPVGVIQQEVIKRFNNLTQSPTAAAQSMQMFLQGDPAIRLFSPQKPDYLVQNNGITITPFNNERLTAASDSFTIVIPVKNVGKAVRDPLYVSVQRNNHLVIDSVLFQPVLFQDTLYFKFTDKNTRSPGLNQFTIFLDHLNKIGESDENNNSHTFEFYFPGSNAQALYPPEFSIISEKSVKLTGQLLDTTTKVQEYYFELDTSPDFTSSGKKSAIISSANNLPTWKVELPNNQASEDSVVYFWRFRANEIPAGQDSIVWGSSSFRYIPGSQGGWSQSKPAQFSRSATKGITFNPVPQQWEFTPSTRKLVLKTGGGKTTSGFPPNGIFIDGRTRFDASCGFTQANVLVAVFNDKTLAQHIMPAGSGSVLCGSAPKTMYQFTNLGFTQNQENLRLFLESVPAGYYVALISVKNVPFSTFSQPLKNAFRQLGSLLIDSVKTGFPLALVGRKGGTPGTAKEVMYLRSNSVEAAAQEIELETTIQTRGAYGEITSTFVGPATEWNKLQYIYKQNGAGKDRSRISVIGYDALRAKDTIIYTNASNKTLDLSKVKASRYPYLRLQVALSDTLDRSSPQLTDWLVLYQGTPEGVVRPDTLGPDFYTNLTSQATKGKISTQFAFQNISDQNFRDSLVARISVIGTNGFTQDIKFKPLAKGELAFIPFTFATRQLSGKYTLRVFVNPRLQPELVYTNNTFEIPFSVSTNLPPILDVVFDGQHILDGDIVSPNPFVTVAVKDEDKFSFLKDTENLEILIKKPNSATFEKVDLKNGEAKVFPADKNNDLKVEFNLKNLENGIHALRVQAKDVSNNKAGFEPYEINFNVINESTITNFYPYPNPVTSKTRFVFTVTGAEIPQNLKVQILTVSGKVVREITKEELGQIKIGNNTSDYAWDGTDQFGDKLANGVYLYRVVMDTDLFTHRNTAGDKAFKKGYGKLYILR